MHRAFASTTTSSMAEGIGLPVSHRILVSNFNYPRVDQVTGRKYTMYKTVSLTGGSVASAHGRTQIVVIR